MLSLSRSPFKKPEEPPSAKVKRTLTVLGFLALLAFWSINASPAVDVRDNAMEARGHLVPLEAAPVRPAGGGMANASVVVAKADDSSIAIASSSSAQAGSAVDASVQVSSSSSSSSSSSRNSSSSSNASQLLN